ncbi:MAG: glutamyl-tRNA reductase [Nannocystaceae bacterium]|nr:glutamyl-tRNA reductase [Nannocystaceae bacterium]
MSGELIAVGLNYKSAPVELREQLAIAADDHGRVLTALREHAGLAEAMVVSTCNRVEVYGVPAAGREHATVASQVMPVLAELQRVTGTHVGDHAFVRRADEAARHIFRVTASLESLVVGEPQILGQVKDAFERAREQGAIGPVLDRCLSLAFKSAKRVRTETEIAKGAANVSSVAVDLARSIFGELHGCMALVVGAGEMAEQAAVHLREGGVAEIAVVNRSAGRGEALAEKVNGHYEPWDRLAAELVRADIVIASTGASTPVIDRALLKPVLKPRRGRPLFLVDIAVPRDVAADVTGLPQVFVYNVDDLQQIVHDNLRSRRGEAERAAAMVEEEVGGFVQWLRTRGVGPMLGQLQAFGREVAEIELRKHQAKLAALSPEQQGAVEALARGIVQKLLHRPMAAVRKAGSDGNAGSFDAVVLAEALAQLFELSEPPVAVVEAPPRRSEGGG